MKKTLQEMTPEELGQLFPIEIVDYNKDWVKLYKMESRKIVKAVSKENIEKIYHIGSTSVKGLKAKPTIDILLEIKTGTDLEGFKNSMISIGYEADVNKENPPYIRFYKGYTINGFSGQAYHLHIRYKGVQNELVFINYLKKHPKLIREYEELKLSLKDKFKNDRDGYTDAKTDFINRVLEKAKVKK